MKYHIKITSSLEEVNHTWIQTNDFEYYEQLRSAFLDEFHGNSEAHIRDVGHSLTIILLENEGELN